MQLSVPHTGLRLRRDKLPFADKVPVGVMIEVPAAAMCIDILLDEVDFVSIGSNDLIQYVMAADRDNPKVAHLTEPFSPAIYRLLNYVIAACVALTTFGFVPPLVAIDSWRWMLGHAVGWVPLSASSRIICIDKLAPERHMR